MEILKVFMSRFFRLLIVVITGSSIVSQAQDSRFTLNLAVGKSLSMREVATKIFGETRGGELADDGLGAQIVASYYPTRRIGLAARFSYNQNNTREEGIKLIASGQYGVVNPVVVSSEGWTALSGMIGPTLCLGGERLGLEGRLLVGYATVKSPNFTTKGAFQNYEIQVITNSQNAQDWAYGAGATFHIGITSAVALVINADATLISTTFKNVSNQVSTTGFPEVNQQVNIDQHVGVMNVTGGLRFSF
ncbi:hypothetical protein [Runella zeae]|uniref:hypothetical protein n=1 Tax=Runella zeae TaxID=94255 RepID=UPI0023528E6C|nr:hypothetical protein [Runella zeae]